MTPDKVLARVTIARRFSNECGIQDDIVSGKTRIVGRRKAQQFVFEHLVGGAICIPSQTLFHGTPVTVITIWSVKEEEEEEK